MRQEIKVFFWEGRIKYKHVGITKKSYIIVGFPA